VFDTGHPGGPPATATEAGLLHVAVLAYPHISNLDEFQPLRQLPGVRLHWARGAADLEAAQWIILPGSKQVSGDLAWLRAQDGLEAALRRHASAGRPLLGICGGLQMLGRVLHDPEGVDGEAGGPVPGLGLLPLTTRYAAPKRVLAQAATFHGLSGVWHALEGVTAPGYEIRNGRTEADSSITGTAAAAVLHAGCGEAIGWQSGSVLGVYLHGLFESSAVLQALWGGSARTLEASLDGLADLVEQHFSPGLLAQWR
jgi:adenosylcobyric acid synthase